MEEITKKRFKAILIDSFISSAVSLTAEYFMRKRIKNEALYNVVLPMASMYALEYLQLKRSGQTAGYRLMGLKLTADDGEALTGEQIVKRMVHRDTTSTWSYLTSRKQFEGKSGAILPHDEKTGTIVKEG